MTKTETPATLTAALAKLQTIMEQPKRSVENTYYKSKYADLRACFDAVKPHLEGLGLAVTQTTDVSPVGLVLITTLRHVSGELVTSSYPVTATQNTPQALGSAMTYARRYALNALLGIAPEGEDDDGNAASEPAKEPKSKAPSAAEKAKAAAADYIKRITAAKTAEAADAVLAEVEKQGGLPKLFPELYAEVVQEHKAHVEYLDRKGA